MASLAKFFKKAAPLADDIAGAIVNYGDDAARLAANYGDDVLEAVGKSNFAPWDLSKDFDSYGPDDVLPFGTNSYGQTVIPLGNAGAIIDGKTFHYPTKYSPQNALKEKLLDKRIGVATRPESPKLSNISEYADPDFTFPTTTSVLGDAILEHSWAPTEYDFLDYAGSSIAPYDVFNQSLANPISTSGMVIQTPEVLNGISHSDDGAFGLRPHRNTALGRWFAKNNPNYGWDVDKFPF